MNGLLYLSVLACACAMPQLRQQEINISVHRVSSQNNTVSSQHGVIQSSSSVSKIHVEESSNNFFSTRSKNFISTRGDSDNSIFNRVSSENNMVSSQHGVIQSSSFVNKTHVEESSNNFFSTRNKNFFSTRGDSDNSIFNIGVIRKRIEENMNSWPTQVVIRLNGFEEQDISVTITPGMLKVVADHGGNHYESTRSISPFVEPDNSSYKFKNGVLTITFQLEENVTTQKPDREELESHEEESTDQGIDIEMHGTTQNPEQEELESNEGEDSDFDETKDVELIN